MRILIPVDGSSFSDAALKFIASRPFGEDARPQIDLLNVQLPIPPRAGRAVGAEIVRAWHEAESTTILKPAIRVLRQAHLDPAWNYRVGNPAVEIAEWAEQHAADLIAMGSHGHSAVKGLLFGSVTQKVLATTTIPLLALRDAQPPGRASLRVGIALDGSGYGIAAMHFVLQQLALFGPAPTFTLIHVVPPAVAATLNADRRLPVGAEPSPAVATAISRILNPVRKRFAQAGLATHEHGLIGEPGDEIARFARAKRLDLLVMGSHGRGALKAALLGSVARRVGALCTTPLLLIRRSERAGSAASNR